MRMLFTLLIVLFCIETYSQAPGWAWADGAGGNSTDRGQCVFTDPVTGDVVVAGFYESEGLYFGAIQLINTLNNFTSDIFVVKYNAAGNVLWANTYGGTGSERANGVAIDASGNVIVTGHFDSPTLAFGPTTLTSTGESHCFILKLNASGAVVWAQQSTGNDGEFGTNIALDNSGNAFVGGYFRSSSISFGTMSGSIIGASSDDIFVAKFNTSGICQWLNVAGGTKLEDLQGIAVDSNNDVIISGGFKSAVLNAGASSLANFQVNTYDAFIIKYTGSGVLSWITGLGGFYSESAMNVTTDNNSNIFITGYFETQLLPVGSTTLTNTTSSGFLDMYIAKMNPSGVFQWAHSSGGIYDEYGSAVATDASGNIYMTGYYDSDTISAGPATLINNGSWDMAMVKYTNSGTFVWAKNTGGGGYDRSESIAVNNSGEVFLTGHFGSNTIDFGTTTLTNFLDHDIFIAKLSSITGLADHFIPDWIKIYAEGNTGNILIKSQFALEQIIITNLMGQRILNDSPYTNEFSTAINNTGIYFVEVISDGVRVRKKVFVTQ